jgi:photosystem II stability/assembly factor-like uncharacterized protein
MRYLVFLLSILFISFWGCEDNQTPIATPDKVDINWEQTNGPYGGWVNSILFTKSGDLLMASRSGLYISNDNGENYRRLSMVDEIILDLHSGSNGEIIASSDHSIYSSNDEGKNWAKKSINLFISGNYKILFSNNGSIILEAEGNKILSSINNGESWTDYGFPSKGSITGTAANSRGKIFLATQTEGIFITADKGNSWTKLDSNLTGTKIFCIFIDENDIIYISSNTGKLKRSTDDGKTWEKLNPDISYANFKYILKENNTFILTVDNLESFISIDNGKIWKELKFNDARFNKLISNKNGLKFLAAGIGIFKSSDNGANWEDANKGFTGTYILGIVADKNDNLYSTSLNSSAFFSSDKGNSWKKIDALSDKYISGEIFINKQNVIYACSFGHLTKSTDNGITWKIIYNNILSQCYYYDNLKENSKGELFALGPTGELLHSLGGDENWEYINLPCKSILNYDIDKNDIIYILPSPFFRVGDDNNNRIDIYMSMDNGKKWKAINNCQAELEYSKIKADNMGGILVTDNYNLYRICDLGVTGRKEAVLKFSSYPISLISDGKNTVIAATSGGDVYISQNNGYNWQKTSFKNEYGFIQRLTIDSKNNIYIGTENRGVYKGIILSQY